jgi:hypothetical protein
MMLYQKHGHEAQICPLNALLGMHANVPMAKYTLQASLLARLSCSICRKKANGMYIRMILHTLQESTLRASLLEMMCLCWVDEPLKERIDIQGI